MTRKTEIHTDEAPPAVGPYAQGVLVGDELFTAGQIGLDPESGTLVSEEIAQQTERVLKNLSAVVREAGGTLDDTVKTTVYLTDLKEYETVNDVYADYYGEPFPARSCVEVADLPRSARVEIDLVAYLESGSR